MRADAVASASEATVSWHIAFERWTSGARVVETLHASACTPSSTAERYVQDVYEHVLEGVNLHRLVDAIDKEGPSALVVNSLEHAANVDRND